MNYERFLALCKELGTTPTAVVLQLGYERSSVTRWKMSASENNGFCSVNSSILLRIAKFFNVTTDYLLGLSDERRPAASTSDLLDSPRKLLLLDEAEGMTDKSLEQVIRMMRVIKGMQD